MGGSGYHGPLSAPTSSALLCLTSPEPPLCLGLIIVPLASWQCSNPTSIYCLGANKVREIGSRTSYQTGHFLNLPTSSDFKS